MIDNTNRDLIVAAILDAAKKAGSSGVPLVDAYIPGVKPARMHKVFTEMVAAGQVFKGKIGHRTMRMFSKREWAAAFESTRRRRDDLRFTSSHARAQWAPDSDAIYPVDAAGQPLYKFTVIPARVPPGNRIVPFGGCGESYSFGLDSGYKTTAKMGGS